APEAENEVEGDTAPPVPASTPGPPSLPPTPTPPASKRWGCLRQLGLLLLAALLGAFLALLAIYLINGTLNFGRHEAIIALHSDVDTLSTQVQQQNTTVSDLNSVVQDTTTQMDELAIQVQTIDRHLNILADDLNAMRDDLVTLAEQNAAIQQQLTVIDTQIERLNRTAERFDTFAAGLKELADAIQPQTIITPTATITPTQPITSTAPITSSAATPVPDIITESAPNAVSGSLALQIFPSRTAIFTPTPGNSLILGLVWDDLNGNGLPEANEIPLPAVRITLKNIQGETIAKTDTTGDGRYTFPELTPGAYVLTEFDPPGTTSITANSVTVTTVANSIVEINFADTHLP
ncbi:MAG: hypothetical protein GXP37_05485, partial [Chloroflexi bacterium]|nr:hypothetical protein [Chloroflexota bacterium]